MSDPATAAQTEPQAFMRSVLQRIATGPEYSKDLPQEEARAALNLILNGQADPVQAGIFFIALRMKRETLEEN
ncbi:MAG: anthranilate phosphoribosyltransferase, partial [Gammaproteobacteria bacterium]|nr:anthranilate phosphoribosyltransferase [Gammaproteobacteria bacterium]MDE0302722.1 anthranilate phosphoribosyltransferase [Gammaproteobacteria bacterium]